MSRTTIDFGIDLGTTNSAIAVLKGVQPEIIKNELDADITPSAVSYNKKGEQFVGQRAKNRIIDSPSDAYIEFKRRMGSDHIYHFDGSGLDRKPEELSAEVLKSLKGDAQQKTGEAIEAAVITVPAAFKLHQCEATKKAAQLAGFKQHALLQEPVAAALAFGYQADTQKAYWLVYDFGGGTFDAALMQAEEGTIHVVEHGGDNFLGGSNIDWALVEKLIAPRILEEYDLKDFNRANAGIDNRWYSAFVRLKAAAEQAKIALSRKEVATLDPDYVKNLVDASTGEIVIEELELRITQDELIKITEPFIMRSTDIVKQVLKKKGLAPSAIERLILVGGPTKAQYFRDILAAELGIALDYSLDPLTVVARGAAVFAGTQRLITRVAGVAPVGEFSVELTYNPVGVDSSPTVGGKVSGDSIRDWVGYTVELVNEKSKWRSGKITLNDNGIFMATLHAERGDRNTYLLELFDPSGRKRKVTPNQIVYSIGASPDEQPLIHTMGIALANNEFAKFLDKGTGLPAKKKRILRSAILLRQGQSGELLRIPVVEGENDLADRNSLVGSLDIHATNIRRDLPAGSELEVTLSVDTSRGIRVQVFCPLLDDDVLDGKLDLLKRDLKPDRLSAECNSELKRLQELKLKASGTGGETAKAAIAEAEKKLVERVQELEAAAKGNRDAAAECEERLLELKAKLDEAADALEWPALEGEVRQLVERLDNTIERCEVTEDQEKKAAQLKTDVEEIIKQKKMDRLRKRRDQIESLYWDIVFAQDGFWVDCFNKLEKDKHEISDHARGDRLFDQGRKCIQNNNPNGLRSVVTQLWDLLPKAPTKDEMRGYGGGLSR